LISKLDYCNYILQNWSIHGYIVKDIKNIEGEHYSIEDYDRG